MSIPTILTFGPAGYGSWHLLDPYASGVNEPEFDLLAGYKAAQRIYFPQSGSVTDVGFSLVSSTGTPPDYSASIVTPATLTDATPALYGGCAKTDFTPGSVGWTWVTLSTAATVVQGEPAWAIIENSGTPPDGSNYITIATGKVGSQENSYFALKSSSWGAGGSEGGDGPMAVRYDDGTVAGLAAVSMYGGKYMITVGDSPDEVGAKFTVPFDCTINRVKIANSTTEYWPSPYSDYFYGGASTVKLYDSADNVLMTYSLDYGLASRNVFDFNIADVDLIANATYRLTQTAAGSDSSSSFRLACISFGDESYRSALPEGEYFSWTERTAGGSWTDDNTICPYMAIVTKTIG